MFCNPDVKTVEKLCKTSNKREIPFFFFLVNVTGADRKHIASFIP